MRLLKIDPRGATCLLILLTTTFACGETTPGPADIPKVEPVVLDLAGAARPQVARFLLAQGAQFSEGAPFAPLSSDGTQIAFQSTVTGQAPVLPPGIYQLAFAAKASVLAIHVVGPATPGEIWIWTPGSEVPARLVVAPSAAGLDLSQMIQPEFVTFPASDGVRLSGLLYRPRMVQGSAPVFLRLHGGPSAHAQAVWNPLMQYLCSRGIAVLDFNYRGSTGAGKSFARLNDRRLRVNEIGDVVDAVQWLRQQPGLDGQRLAVGGGSYGGYLTNAVLGLHPDLFVAGVSMVGVSDWVTNLEDASPDLKASDRVEYGDITDPADRAFFASISPINNASKIRTPLLVETGANDPRIRAPETDLFVAAIRKAGTPVRYFRFPDEGHAITNLANKVHFYTAFAAFLEERYDLAKKDR